MSTHFDNLKKYFPELENATILDLGSGKGDFLIEAAQKGGAAYGLEKYQVYIDITKEKAQKLNLDIDVRQGVAEKLPFDNDFFDVVNMAEVLEHVENPDTALKEVHRVLRQGGGAYISVPNRYGCYDPHFHLYGINWMSRGLAHRVIGLFGRHKEYTDDAGKQRIDTMYYDTKKGFTKRAAAHGFTVTDGRLFKIKQFKNPLKRLTVLALYVISSSIAFQTNHFIVWKV